MSYQKIKGTQDFYGLDALKMRFIEDKIIKTIKNYGYEEIITPIFEATEVFIKNVGESSDIVTKEMYTFLDKGNRSITLRPEGTAACARSYIENKMYATNAIKKLYYIGPMFRYERPQAGRFRQFVQFGVEVYGPSNPVLDCDIIASANAIFKELGLNNVVLKINTIGDSLSRANYSKALKEYFEDKKDDLCPDCLNRLVNNPLRILDCKVDSKKEVVLNAPLLKDYLSDEAKMYFEEVKKGLDALGIKYIVDNKLVRGLDYYTDTVFEFVIDSNDELSGLAVAAGGKYANMLYDMAKLDIPGMGYAFGVERVKMLMEVNGLFNNLDKKCDYYIISLDKESKLMALNLANKLREYNKKVEFNYGSYSLKTQFKESDRLDPDYILIIGEDERINNLVTIKNTKTKEQRQIKVDMLYEEIQNENA